LRTVDPAALDPAQRHRLLAGLVRAHAVAVLSTADAGGRALVAPLGYCLPLHGERAMVGITLAAVRDAGGEPAEFRAAAQARGELVAHLTASDLAGHLTELGRAERDPATGVVRWAELPSRRVAVPSLATGRARLECRIHAPAGPPGAAGVPAIRSRVTATPTASPGDYVLFAEVVCVVTELDTGTGTDIGIDADLDTEVAGRRPGCRGARSSPGSSARPMARWWTGPWPAPTAARRHW
jgi:flavin reductase (DIM6/NTAB) family NADH-FMN oxidoreductase RutF